MSQPFTLQFQVAEEENDTLLRSYLLEKNISRKALTDIKADGLLLVNGQEENVQYMLKSGDSITVQFPPESGSEQMKGEDLPLDIIYEDDYLLAVNKPAGISTIPSRQHPSGTLANAIVHYYEQIGHCGAVHFVNRLDLDTSGLVLIAKHRHTHHLFSLAQEEQAIVKKYLAIIPGKPEIPEDRIDQPIARTSDSIIKREVRPDGQTASTIYTTLSTFSYQNETCSLIQLHLLTGRTHQIRVHMSWLGHPLLGDSLYDGDCTNMQRQALHCTFLQFQHPVTGETITIEAPLPDDMKSLLPE
ncbi:MAG: RluA family pseudouridine synthase [Peptococcaceae bacterium]|nr:RluA family pseudouridine synthase [Peptococcaceae bacterium]